MKIIIEQDQLHRIVFNYLNKKYGYLEPINPPGTIKNYVQFIDKNGNLLMDGTIGEELLVDKKLWSFIKDMFGFISDDQVRDIIGRWTYEKYGYEWDDNIVPDYMIT